jgi:hypothetical protein
MKPKYVVKLSETEHSQLKEQWCIPPIANVDFVYCVEVILVLYTQPEEPKRLLVCMDEVPYLLIADLHDPLPI